MKLSGKKTGGSLRLYSREVDGTHKVYVEITDSTLKINQQDGATSTLETKTVATSASTWYDYHIISDGSHMEVWRGPHGGTTELMLETDALTIWNSDSIILESRGATASYDNVEFIAADTAKTVMDYDAANELTTSITGAITTTYAYDDWGRTISKTDGTLSAEYLWRFGDKLKEYNTDFPGEHSVAFNYDGLGKRRCKVPLDAIGGYDPDDFTWYRWAGGWNMIGEYEAGSDVGSEWDIGTLSIAAISASNRLGGGEYLGVKVSGVDCNIIANRLDRVVSIYSASNIKLGAIDYASFGAMQSTVGAPTVFSLDHKLYFAETQSYYFPYRLYSPSLMRWLTRDPMPRRYGNSLYAYTANNPTFYVDPLGIREQDGTGLCLMRLENGQVVWVPCDYDDAALAKCQKDFLTGLTSCGQSQRCIVEKYCEFLKCIGSKCSDGNYDDIPCDISCNGDVTGGPNSGGLPQRFADLGVISLSAFFCVALRRRRREN